VDRGAGGVVPLPRGAVVTSGWALGAGLAGGAVGDPATATTSGLPPQATQAERFATSQPVGWLAAPRGDTHPTAGNGMSLCTARVRPRSRAGTAGRDARPGALATIAAAPVAQQDRFLREHGGLVADHIANELVRRAPRLAARSGFARWQRAAGTLAALAVVALVVLAPTLLSVLLVGAIVTITLGHALLAGCGVRRDRRRRSAVRDTELPTYTILIAAYREREVIGGLVECLERLDFPRDRLEALILVERRDHQTKAAIRAVNPASFIRVVEIPPGSPQTKPRSLNAGLLLAKGELLVVYDAEDRPEPDQLRIVAERFLESEGSLACVQAKLAVANARRSFVTRQFAIEYGLRYELLFPGLARLGLPVPLGGTSNHFRTSVLRRLGGWDAWNVTEDADLGIRCAALGYRVELIDSITWGEMPHRVGPWTRQRSRWLKGWLLTALVHTRNPIQTWRALGGKGTIALLLVLAGTPLLYLAQSLALALWASGHTGLLAQEPPAKTILALAQLVALSVWTVPLLVAARRRGIGRSVLSPLALAYWAMHWAAAWRALRQLISSPFTWDKTPHRAMPPLAT
jgi:glycosyltransferase XagB